MNREKIIEGFSDESPVTVVVVDKEISPEESVHQIATAIPDAHIGSFDQAVAALDSQETSRDHPVLAACIYPAVAEIPFKDLVTLDRIIVEGASNNVAAVVYVQSELSSLDLIAQSSGMLRHVLDNSLVLDGDYADTMLSGEEST